VPLRGHNDTPFGRRTPGWPIGRQGIGPPQGVFCGFSYLSVMIFLNIAPLMMEFTNSDHFFSPKQTNNTSFGSTPPPSASGFTTPLTQTPKHHHPPSSLASVGAPSSDLPSSENVFPLQLLIRKGGGEEAGGTRSSNVSIHSIANGTTCHTSFLAQPDGTPPKSQASATVRHTMLRNNITTD
jgi:hypothetical protein